MNKLIWALICLAAALAAKLLPKWNLELAWRIDEHTHRGIPFNDIVFWVLLIAGAMFLLMKFSAIMRAPHP